MKNILIFIAGAAVGSLITWKIVEERCKRISDEEIKSVVDTFEKRRKELEDMYTSADSDNLGIASPSKEFYNQLKSASDELIEDYNKKLNKYGYKEDDLSDVINDNSGYAAPYVISPEEFGEREDYETKSLIYYTDKIVADDDDHIVDDVEDIIGDALDHFGDYEDDAVHVRNEKEKCDYEILRSEKAFDELINFEDVAIRDNKEDNN